MIFWSVGLYLIKYKFFFKFRLSLICSEIYTLVQFLNIIYMCWLRSVLLLLIYWQDSSNHIPLNVSDILKTVYAKKRLNLIVLFYFFCKKKG